MASLKTLKTALRQQVPNGASMKPLSDIQYREGFDMFLQYLGREMYEQFTIPQLSQQIVDLSCSEISVLEIGPGPKSFLAYLPGSLRQRSTKYTAFEPNSLLCEQLREWLSTAEVAPFPSSKATVVHQKPFGSDTCTDGRYNVILFCHSLYGMASQVGFVKNALSLLVDKPDDGLIIVFHRSDSLHVDSLVCHRSAYFPDGTVRIEDKVKVLGKFALFIAGCVLQDKDEHENV
jgi:hypothetical protein